MHIILDSNIYLADIQMAGISFQNLFGLVRRTQSTLVLPHMVREEVVARYQDRLRRAIDSVQKAWKPYRDLMIDEKPEEFDAPEIQYQRRELRRRLKKPAKGIQILNQTETEGVDIKDVYLRGINRKRPASETGEELRDVILWLATLAYAKKCECPVVFVSGDKGFWSGNAVALAISEDIAAQKVDVRVFPSLKELITNESPEPVSISAKRIEALFDPELLKQTIVSATRDAMNSYYNNYRSTSVYSRGDMTLTTFRFSSGSQYTIDPEVDFVEITFPIELLWSEARAYYPQQSQQGALADLAAAFSPGFSLGFTSDANPVESQSQALQKAMTFKSRERISGEALVFARILKGVLQTFEVHEVTIKSVARQFEQSTA